MESFSAYLLVFHGSRDRRPQKAAETLAQFFAERIQHTNPMSFASSGMVRNGLQDSFLEECLVRLSNSNESTLPAQSEVAVGVASLECSDKPLHEQIVQFVRTLPINQLGHQTISVQVLPLFLLQGVHVMEDIPAELALAQGMLGQTFSFEIAPHLGSHPGLYRIITERMSALPLEAWVLLSHGSRRLGANDAVETLAERLGAVTAYWSTPPDLESRLRELAELGLRRIAILPYFLFSGSTTDAIAQLVNQLSKQFPTLDLHLTPALEATPEMADLLVDLVRGEGVRG